MLLNFTTIAQSNIPISTVVPTHHVSSFNTHLLKIFFQNFLGAPGALAHYFRIPLLPLHTPYFFRRFDLISHFLLHGSAKGLPLVFLTHISYSLFQKKIFKNFLGPFLRAPGALVHYFRIPLLPLHTPIFFPTFRHYFLLPSSR